MKRLVSFMAPAMAAFLLIGCSAREPAVEEQQVTRPPRIPYGSVYVTLEESMISGPELMTAGRVTFIVTNRGAEVHNFEIQGPGVDRGFRRGLQPGETQVMTVTLEPGTYTMRDPIGANRLNGMEVTLRVKRGGGL